MFFISMRAFFAILWSYLVDMGVILVNANEKNVGTFMNKPNILDGRDGIKSIENNAESFEGTKDGVVNGLWFSFYHIDCILTFYKINLLFQHLFEKQGFLNIFIFVKLFFMSESLPSPKFYLMKKKTNSPK